MEPSRKERHRLRMKARKTLRDLRKSDMILMSYSQFRQRRRELRDAWKKMPMVNGRKPPLVFPTTWFVV